MNSFDVLNALLKDDGDDDETVLPATQKNMDETVNSSTTSHQKVGVNAGDNNDKVIASSEEEEEEKRVKIEWDDTVKKYVRQPVSALEKERDEYFSNIENHSWKEATSEIELFSFKRER